MDSSEMPGGKARRELRTNAMRCFEQSLEVVANKTAVVQPLANHPSKTSKICWALLEK